MQMSLIQQSTILTGPASNTYIINFTASTGVTLNVSENNAMVAFLSSLRVTNSSDCYNMDLTFTLYSQNQYSLVVTTYCTMIITLFQMYRIIFDVTYIESQGVTFFQYGVISTINSQTSTLYLQSSPFLDSNFMLGMKSFNFTIKQFKFTSTLGSNTTIAIPNSFTYFSFSYWSLKMRQCPSNMSYFQVSTSLCYDICPDATYGYITNLSCIDCFYGCKVCTSTTTCTTCYAYRTVSSLECVADSGYFDNGNSDALKCSDYIAFCGTCTNSSICISCYSGYILSNNTCTQCTNKIVSCSTCTLDSDGCFVCSDGSLILQIYNNNGTSSYTADCVVCSDVNCINCTSVNICVLCVVGYGLTSTSTCGICWVTYCLSCEQNYLLCTQCSIGYGVSINGTVCSVCLDVNCVTCSNDNQICTICDSGYLLQNDSTCAADCSGMIYCIKCSSTTNCTQCNQSQKYYLNGTFCEVCSLEGCLSCASLTACAVCNNSDGYFLNQTSFFCQVCSLNECLVCLNLKKCSICNGSYIVDSVTDTCFLCEELVGCVNCTSSIKCTKCQNGYILDTLTNLCVEQQSCLKCSCFSDSVSDLPSTVSNLVFSQEQCQRQQKIQKSLKAVTIGSYIVFIFSSFSINLIGIQAIGVPQLAHVVMAAHKFTPLYLSPITSWSFVHGYNIKKSQVNVVPQSVSEIGYGSDFLSNINIMLLLCFVSCLSAIIVKILIKYFNFHVKYSKMQTISKVLNTVFFTLIMFNCINSGFSVGLHLKYSDGSNIFSNFCCISTILLYFGTFIWIFASDKGLNIYQNKSLKGDSLSHLYFSLYFLCRFCLPFYLAYQNQSTNCTLFMLAFEFFILVFVLINPPYNKFHQNYRSIICHFTQLVILLVAFYYQSLQLNESVEIKNENINPSYLQIVSLFVCLSFSLASLIYESFVFVKKNIISKFKVNNSYSNVFNKNNTETNI